MLKANLLACALSFLLIGALPVAVGTPPSGGRKGVLVPASGPPAEKLFRREVVEGIASWYGSRFHGKKTASGERFDQRRPTLACRDFPLGSRVQVVNLSNGRKCIARVNDRGPRVKGRRFDLSKRAAQVLGMKRSGLARVRVSLLRR